MAQEEYKVAVITGGTRGIGYAIANSLARSGYKGFVLGYNSDHEAAAKARRELEDKYGVRSVCVQGDLANPAVVRQLFEAVRENFDNRCTAFIHNAGLILGFSSKSTYEKAPVVTERTQQQLLAVSTNPDITPSDTELDDMEERFEYYWRVYTLAFQLGMKLAVRCEGFRHIIAISAPGCNITYSPFIWLDDRGQGKAGMELLVRIAARLYAKKGINCNAVIPGLVLAGGTLNSIEKGEKFKAATDDRATATTGRLMPPSEIGDVVSFLCSPQGLAINGVALPVDNGLHLFGR